MHAPDIPPPTAVLTVVFLAWLAGTAVVGALSRIGGEIQAGHFKVIWLLVAGIGIAAGFGYHPAWAVAGLAVLTFAAIYRRLDHVAGAVTAAASIATLAYGAPVYAFGVAALLGTVTNAMLLGHWHLNQPKLGTKPIARVVWGFAAAIVAFVAATTYMLLSEPATGIRQLGAVTAISFAVFAGVLTGMVVHLVRTRSIMSATGILYLAILLAFVSAFTGSLAVLAVA